LGHIEPDAAPAPFGQDRILKPSVRRLAMSTLALDTTLAELRPMLLKIARLQLRNDTWADDVVSETLLAALEGASRFDGQSQVKTWVVGILKHKIIDQFRKNAREVSVEAEQETSEAENFDDLFVGDGHFRDRPVPTWGDPEASLNRTQFLEIVQACVDKLPAGLGRIFMLREWLEYDTDEICKELGITSTNAFVMLYRARMRLRECLQLNWFSPERMN
jgi:RNA polymerase sigma-70 factor, ECF subfamily